VSRIFRYILVDDHGIAPCPADGLITLATCKPAIRRTATVGDWVLGFRPGSLHRGLLLWGGRVQKVMPHGEYERAYSGRPDALYRQRSDGDFDRVDPSYHPTRAEMDRDLSGPVLIFDPERSVHLDGQPLQLPDDLAHLAAAGRGHRVKGLRDDDLPNLQSWVEQISGSTRKKSAPHAPSTGRRC
jgi:hypothetical protein